MGLSFKKELVLDRWAGLRSQSRIQIDLSSLHLVMVLPGCRSTRLTRASWARRPSCSRAWCRSWGRAHTPSPSTSPTSRPTRSSSATTRTRIPPTWDKYFCPCAMRYFPLRAEDHGRVLRRAGAPGGRLGGLHGQEGDHGGDGDQEGAVRLLRHEAEEPHSYHRQAPAQQCYIILQHTQTLDIPPIIHMSHC